MPDEVVRAAGGVVWRDAPSGVEVLLIHRPKYDDWSLPKGKLDDGETEEDAAVREVEEETGLTCTLGAELPGAAYRDLRGRPKTVRYWLMQIDDAGKWDPDDEVDELWWLPIDHASHHLSYDHDVEVVAAARALLATR